MINNTVYPNLDLIAELKELIYLVCDLKTSEIDINSMNEDDPLIGPQSPIGIDSLDAIEIVAAVEKKYSVRINNIDTARQILKNIRTLAEFIEKKSPQFVAG